MRHRQILSASDSLLLVIDYQEKLLKAFKEPDDILKNTIKLIKFAHILSLPIIWTEQYPQGLGRTIEQIKQELPALAPVEKVSFSCFAQPEFTAKLASANRKQLVVCGIETHICVAQTALDALEAGYQPHVVADACGSRKKQDHKAALRKMRNAGAIETSTEMVIYEILERSDTAAFRDVLKLVK